MISISHMERQLERGIWIIATLLVIGMVGLVGYYVYDRYLHPNESMMKREARLMEEEIHRDPNNPDLRIAVSVRFLELGMVNEAVTQAQEAIKGNQLNQSAWTALGRAFLKRGDTEQAAASFAKVVELNKDNEFWMTNKQLEVAHYQLGQLALKKSDYVSAEAEFREALKIDRTDADTRYSLGIALQRQNKHDEAVKEFGEALRFVPSFTEVYEGLKESYQALGLATESRYAAAMARQTLGEYEYAAAELEEVIRAKPDFTSAYLGLGLAYEKLGKRDQAVAALQKVVAVRPGDIVARQALGRLGVTP